MDRCNKKMYDNNDGNVKKLYNNNVIKRRISVMTIMLIIIKTKAAS